MTAPQDNDLQKALQLAIEHIENFATDELQDWLVWLLNGRDNLLPSDGYMSLTGPLAAIYPRLSPRIRDGINRAALLMLGDMLSGRVWAGQAADELLLLIQQVGMQEAEDLLADYARLPRFHKVREDLRYRVCQALAALRVRMTVDFWHQVLRSNPDKFGGVAFIGLTVISPKSAIDLLAFLPDEERVAELIGDTLPLFFEMAGKDGAEAARRHLIQSLPQLAPKLRMEVEEYLQLESLTGMKGEG
ncbi:MAG: hypothetical protein HQK56_16200 [Deltaproteobacteria bacterium]|nr:hypothetical protein [Deltaproteobacteria bacterium]